MSLNFGDSVFRWIAARWLILALVLCPGAVASARALPEFATLIEKHSAVVVNISATQLVRKPRAPFLRPNQEGGVPDWLGRLLPQRPPVAPETEDDRAVGSGFIISTDGYILTNAHVVEDADEVLVRLSDKREYQARIVGTDKRTDIALLKVDATGLPQARLGSPDRLRVGDWVLAIGSPFGFDSSVTGGIVSAKGRSLPDDSIVPFIQTDVAINPGNSGGPLFNLDGEVVGINSQIYSRTGGFMGLSFAIPIDVAMDVQTQLRQRGKVLRGRLGVLIQEVTRDISDSFRLPEARGALVSGVEPESPAARAGLKVGDIILRFDGKLVANSYELPRMVGRTAPGSRSVVQLWRGGALHQASVVVAQFPDDEPSAAPVAWGDPRSPSPANTLGLAIDELSREQRKVLGVDHGVTIRESAGIAARAELRPGDVLTAMIVGGVTHEIRSVQQFNRLTIALPPGSALTVLVQRGAAQSFVGMKVPRVLPSRPDRSSTRSGG